jgi:hypothetical protein
MMNDRVPRIAGCEQRLDVALQLGGFFRQDCACHSARQDNISEEQIYIRVCFQHCQRRGTICRF